MDILEIAARLARLDAGSAPVRFRAEALDVQADGGSGAWMGTVAGGIRYVIKAQNNRHEHYEQDQLQFPLKLPTTELICGRLGQLFEPPICPMTCIVDLPNHVVAEKVDVGTQRPVMAGPGVGSQFIAGAVTVRQGRDFHLVSAEQAARIMVFQTWLNPDDDQAIICVDQGIALSIDHGWYLTGSRWNEERLSETSGFAVVPWIPEALARLEDATLFRDVLDQLCALPEDSIIEQFAGIPPEWGATHECRAKLAAFVLQRRAAVEQAVCVIWKRVA